MPWGELFFRGVTLLGSEYFYLVFIAIWFWAVDKRGSMLSLFVLIVSIVSNYWLKIIFKNPRPSVANWLSEVNASNYSLPSGHAQNSTVVWGWVGLKKRTFWICVISIVLVGLIGLSRVYIGVHWLGDVVAGWAVGLLLLIPLWKLEKPMESFLSKYNPNFQYIGLVIFGLGSIILTECLFAVTAENLEANFGSHEGLIIGLGIGLALEKRYVNFVITPKHGKNWRLALRVILGLILTFAIATSLSIILPEVYLMDAIQYALITISLVFIWPLLFKKFGF
jgi:hypothetical protein